MNIIIKTAVYFKKNELNETFSDIRPEGLDFKELINFVI